MAATASSSPLNFGAAFGEGFGGGLGAALPGAILGAIGMPIQLAEAAKQREFEKSAREAQLAATEWATRQNTANQITGLYAQSGENLAGRNFSDLFANLEQGRQRTAAMEQANIFNPKAVEFQYDVAKRGQELRTNPKAKEEMFQNLLDYKRRKGFDVAAPMEAAFGPTAFSRRFTS